MAKSTKMARLAKMKMARVTKAVRAAQMPRVAI